ncbi:Protein Croc-4 [Manis pentadactyla]|nr:Protein Croc-4 [Manis pentadactyla]
MENTHAYRKDRVPIWDKTERSEPSLARSHPSLEEEVRTRTRNRLSLPAQHTSWTKEERGGGNDLSQGYIVGHSGPFPTSSADRALRFQGRATRERKREASEIPEWIERCYVTGAASSAPQEARSRGERQFSGRGHPSSFSSISQELSIQEEAASFVSGVIVIGHLWLLGKFHDLAHSCLGKSFPMSSPDLRG